MIDFIIRKFIKSHENVKDPSVREAYGMLGSVVGILLNIILSISKIAIGTIFKSISITADGANNLSDVGSSVVTFIGFKISGKPADKDHPFGHARIEYITGLAVGAIIFILGLELVKSSVDKVRNPEITEFSWIMVFVLLFSIAVKVWLSYFNLKLADKISSSTMKATAMDSRNDCISTAAVLASLFVSKYTGLEIDGYMGILVALFIMYSGFSILKDILSPLLGEMPDPKFVEKIENKILSYEGVINIHDLVIHNYGPNRYFATVHAEVDANEDIMKSHDMIDNIERDFARDMDINLVIHLDPIITNDEEINHLRKMTEGIIIKIDERLTMHDFRVVKGETHTNIIFDVVIPVGYDMNSSDLVKKIEKSIKTVNQKYYAVVTVDKNYVSTYVNDPKMM
ncbi:MULTISPECIES: cation diffusion facilitator family transporter [unclassified Sedimentibacter]|uniref:cation diffusion facilitator family transporter n=1 Tax=unclassified Sedimentibacter TaxID=2649220 RepID=UPI0027E0E8A3|nr:cation diffusion facilitator family transporter [Sedimentibacter sp. MB35-C1]WMJ78558.1 cation diffusion facilitator family transporter [Sedimentibacter sp. MB35-C1]